MKRGERALRKKSVIFYARDYRHFSGKVHEIVLFLLLCVLPVTLFFTLLYAPITRAICLWAGNIVAAITNQPVEILSSSFLPGLGGVHFLSLPSRNPSFTHALVMGVAALVAIIVFSQVNRNSRPLMIYICMGLYVQLASCLFFLFWPEAFPYTLGDYSELYMIQTASLWILLPTLFGIALSLLRTGIVARVVAILAQVGIMMLYDIVRYVVYLSALFFCTNLYMATLYFTFGVLFDFIQMVTVYAFYAKKVSESYCSLTFLAKNA